MSAHFVSAAKKFSQLLENSTNHKVQPPRWAYLIGNALVCERFPDEHLEKSRAPHKIKDLVMYRCVRLVGALNDLVGILRQQKSAENICLNLMPQNFQRDLVDLLATFCDAERRLWSHHHVQLVEQQEGPTFIPVIVFKVFVGVCSTTPLPSSDVIRDVVDHAEFCKEAKAFLDCVCVVTGHPCLSKCYLKALRRAPLHVMFPKLSKGNFSSVYDQYCVFTAEQLVDCVKELHSALEISRSPLQSAPYVHLCDVHDSLVTFVEACGVRCGVDRAASRKRLATFGFCLYNAHVDNSVDPEISHVCSLKVCVFFGLFTTTIGEIFLFVWVHIYR